MKPNLREADLLRPQPPSIFQGTELKSMAMFPSWALAINLKMRTTKKNNITGSFYAGYLLEHQ